MSRFAFSLLGSLWVLLSLQIQSQCINAGQVSGANVVYHDIDDVYVSSSSWGASDNEYLDLNDDGANDLTLQTDWIYYSHINWQSIDAGGSPQGALEYSSLAGNPAWIKKHAAGEMIGPSLNWHAENGLLFNVSSDKGTSGNFSGEGYLAYRICNQDTLYGWVRMNCNVSYSGAYLTAYEFAYVISYTGIPHNTDIALGKMIRKSGGCLMVDLPEDRFAPACSLHGYDLTGRRIFQVDLTPGTNCLDVSGYAQGLYILHLTDSNGKTFSGKMIF